MDIAHSPISPGQTSPEPNFSTALSAGLNPRSCVICRRRKVKCDKRHPSCTNCAKARTACIYPGPERAKRRPRKPPDGELINRLRRLEGVIQGMGMSVEEELAANRESDTGRSQEQMGLLPAPPSVGFSPDATSTEPADSPIAKMSNEFGRLVVSEGKSRYLNNRFWSTLAMEIEDLKGILDEPSDEEDLGSLSPATDLASPPADAAFFFNYSSLANDLTSFHPAPEQIWALWCIYKEYNDPVIKMVHLPTMEKQVRAAMQNWGKSNKPMEAFLFAVYFAAVTAMTPEAVQTRFGETRDTLVRRYRFGAEQAFARANFLISEEILVLQAYITYLVCLRCHEDGRVLWSLNGVAVRMATSMGLQRDGTNFNIPPFESEIRRRTWWQLVALEWRGSQDSGIEAIILSHGYDTHLPLNINDADLSPNMTELPASRKGPTDMTFCILRYDLQRSLHKLFAPSSTLAEKERLITETHQHLENDYFKFCDMSRPLDWTICTVAKLIMARQFLILYHPHMKTLPQGTIDRLFVTALDTIEFALRLETERKMIKWGWLFRTYNQWHALAFLLSELIRRTKGPLVQRAWRAVNSTLAEFQKQDLESKRGQLWRPVLKLLHRARQARQGELVHQAAAAHDAKMARTVLNGPTMELPAMVGMDMTPIGPGLATNMRPPVAQVLPVIQAPQGNISYKPTRMSNQEVPIGRAASDNMVTVAMQDLNAVDDQYMFDNTSDSMPMTSQFFANTPGIWPDPSDGTAESGDWFGEWATENNVPTGPTCDAGSSSNITMAATANAWQQDSMIGEGEATGMAWTEWDEVMNEFNAADGQAGQIGPVPWSTSKPGNPLLEETWL